MGEDVNTLYIKDLHTRCIIGVRPEERRKKQDVYISIELRCTQLQGRYTDDLDDTVDYSALSRKILDMTESTSYQLIEALAEAVCRLCLENGQVEEAVVRVNKPGAVPSAKTVGVEIRKQQEK